MHPGLARAACAIVILASAAAPGCGGPSQPAGTQAEATTQALLSADARLRGDWRLAEYRPEVPLEPMFAGLLAVEKQTMTIHFEAGHARATSPTLQADLPYRIIEAGGPIFKIITTKDGAGYASTGQFSDDGNKIDFRAETEPWRGNGTLVRVAR